MYSIRRKRILKTCLPIGLLVFGVFLSRMAKAETYTACIKAQVENEDAGIASYTGVKEDYYADQGVVSYKARGIYAIVYTDTGSYIADGYTNLSGCMTFDYAGGPGWEQFDFLVVTSSKPGNSNTVRFHTGGFDVGGTYPGSQLATYLDNVWLYAGSTKYPLISFDQDWSMFVTASYVVYRVNQGVSGKIFNVGMSNDFATSAHWTDSDGDNSWDLLSSGVGFVHINETLHKKRKVPVAHEIGHMMPMLFRGDNDDDNFANTVVDYNHASVPSSDRCKNVSSYHEDSVEWSTVGFREGFAHFYTTRVFNNRYHSDATYAFDIGSHGPVSAEYWSSAGSSEASGGRIENECSGDSIPDTGIATPSDWLRFYGSP